MTRMPGRGAVVRTTALLGGALVASSSVTWFTAQAPSVLAETVEVSTTGGDAAPGVTGLALVVLAGAAAIALGRPWAARLAGGVVAAAGLALTVLTLVTTGDPTPALEAVAADASGLREIEGPVTRTAAPYVTAALGVLAAAAGVTAVLAAPSWRVARRFDADAGAKTAPNARADDARTRAMDDWDALGRGEDPSAGR